MATDSGRFRWIFVLPLVLGLLVFGGSPAYSQVCPASGSGVSLSQLDLWSGRFFQTERAAGQVNGRWYVGVLPRGSEYEMRIRVDGAPAQSTVRLISLSDRLAIQMSQGVPADGSKSAAVTLTPSERGPFVSKACVVVTPPAPAAPIGSEIDLLYVPQPDISVASTDQVPCEQAVCLRTNSPGSLEIIGNDAAIIDRSDMATVRIGATEQTAAILQGSIRIPERSSAGEYLYNLRIPIQHEQYPLYREQADTLVPVEYVELPVHVGVKDEGIVRVGVTLADGGSAVQSLRTGLQNLQVELQADNGPIQLKPAVSYRLVERGKGGASAPTVARILVETASGTKATGLLETLSATRVLPRGALPLLEIRAENSDSGPVHFLNLAIRPEPLIQRVVIHRSNRSDEEKVLYPGSPVLISLFGPGVSSFESASLGGNRIAVLRDTLRGPNYAEIELVPPRDPRPEQDLILIDQDGYVQNITFQFKPNQRPRALDFIGVKLHGDSTPVALPVIAGQGERPIGGFSRLSLIADRTAIEKDSLYGVQFLNLGLRLKDPRGNVVASHSGCYAVLPQPNENVIRYRRPTDCASMIDLDLAGLLGEALESATPRSQVELTIGHRPESYPDRDPEPLTVVLEREGAVSWDFSMGLPTPLIPLNTDSSAIEWSLSGLFAELSIYKGDRPIPVRLHGGATLTTAWGGGSLRNSMGIPLGLSIPIRNMAGTVNVQLFGGVLLPLEKHNKGLLVFYPGFSLKL